MPTFNTTQTAKHLGVSQKRVRDLIREKRLQATQDQSFKWVIEGKHLKAYILKGRLGHGRARNVDD